VQDRVGDDVEFEVAFHGAQVTYLENLKEAIEDNEFKEALKQQVQAADEEVEAAHAARAARLASIFRARQQKKKRERLNHAKKRRPHFPRQVN
jgi:hypothetical protein